MLLPLLVASLPGLLLHGARWPAAVGPLLQRPPTAAAAAGRSAAACAMVASEPTPAQDLVGDGGVLKTVLRPGSGERPSRGATVEVHYEGKLAETGAVFDSSRARGKTFRFTLGEGKVIGGWEVGLSSMAVGELSTLECSPQYAYGAKGIPPMIPPSSTLRFEVELVSVQLPQGDSGSFAADNPLSPRTPQAIKSAYESKMAQKEATAPKDGLDGFIEWAKSIYIFGLFSTKGEKPPWYLNPLITFPIIFAIVGVGFYLVVALDGVHRGEVPLRGDDLSDFIGETQAP